MCLRLCTLDQNPQAMRQRRETVEHPFGTIKARMGATHFLMKTLPRVAGEMALHVLACNLTRVMNIIGTKPLIAAIRVNYGRPEAPLRERRAFRSARKGISQNGFEMRCGNWHPDGGDDPPREHRPMVNRVACASLNRYRENSLRRRVGKSAFTLKCLYFTASAPVSASIAKSTKARTFAARCWRDGYRA
jgi:hypothetical protein